jgi:predicted exporter/SAM-dependent methyltransferase
MRFRGYHIRLTVLVLTVAVLWGMTLWVQSNLSLSSDILSSIPDGDPVLLDARYVFNRYRLPDKVAIDLSLPDAAAPNRDLLADAADYLVREMKQSALFEHVGIDDAGPAVVYLMFSTTDNLPVLFARDQLERNIFPLLDPKSIQAKLQENIDLLEGFEGIGQADTIAKDPLGLRFLVLERLRESSDIKTAGLYKGHMFSADGRHTLVVAQTKRSGTDSEAARQIGVLINRVSAALERQSGPAPDKTISIKAVGSFQAALDNENTARRDVFIAVGLSTFGIVVLLLVSFPRPLIGLFSLLPGLAGTITALFVISCFRPNLSIMALGFGGAIISFTVDSGIAFLLFLDRTSKTTGRQSSHEISSVELMAMITTAGAFLALFFSGFEIMAEVGLFSALSALFTFVFVHSIMPRIFYEIPPAKRRALLPLERIANAVALKGGWPACMLAAGFACVMTMVAAPVYNADLNAMNAISAQTSATEKAFKQTWGDIFNRIFFLSEGKTIPALRRSSDELALFFADQTDKGQLDSAFTASDVVPGDRLASSNLDDWRGFWTQARVSRFRDDLAAASVAVGFKPDAFQAFLDTLANPGKREIALPENAHAILGVYHTNQDNLLISTAKPGPHYHPGEVFKAFHQAGLGHMLDARLFTERLSVLLHGIFMKTLLIVGSGLVLVLMLYYLDLTLTLLTLLPVVFAIVCTLGTFTLIGHPVDIPGLMLSVVVLGIGVVFSIYFVRTHQRYLDEWHPSLGVVRSMVLIAATAILIGFAGLALARHPLLASAGLAAVCGVLYSFVGTNTLLPPLLRLTFKPEPFPAPVNTPAGSRSHRQKVLARYRHLEVYARMFARFKMQYDPMFPRLAEFLPGGGQVLDIGCGYGVQAVWLKTLHAGMRICALEPDEDRARIARRVLSADDSVFVTTAQSFRDYPERVEAVLMLDMIHYMPDDELERLLKEIHGRLSSSGRLILRVTVPSQKRFAWERWLEIFRNRISRVDIWLRSAPVVTDILNRSGFRVVLREPCRPAREETWYVAVSDNNPGVGV